MKRGYRCLLCHSGKVSSLCISIVLASATTGKAADTAGTYAVRGLGTLSCNEVVARVEEAAGQIPPDLIAWSDGALTVSNRLLPATYDLMPFRTPPDLTARLAVNVCRSFLDITFDKAVNEVIALLGQIRLTEQEAEVSARIGEQEIQLAPSTLSKMSATLIRRGFLDFAEPGDYGPHTADALIAFQADQGLPQTGLPDQETLLRLLL